MAELLCFFCFLQNTHKRVSSYFVRSSSGLNFACFAAALSQRAGRDSTVLCGECTTRKLRLRGCGLQVYLAPARLHPEAFEIRLQQQPRCLLKILDL